MDIEERSPYLYSVIYSLFLFYQTVRIRKGDIMRLPEVLWAAPLSVRLQSGTNRLFASVYDALDFLEHEWPIRHGQGYERAVTTCRGALNRSVPSAVAREAFIGACMEANMQTSGVAAHYHARSGPHGKPLA